MPQPKLAQKSIDQFVKETAQRIEEKLGTLLPRNDGPYSELFRAARYSLLGGGKRARPMLALAATEVLEGNLEDALIPACALEIVHTYSLIHDDLPCMDDDDFRRGKPSLHKAFAEGHAVLTGDFLLTYAFELLSQTPNLSAEQKLQLISILSRSAGAHGMIGGQVMDLAEKSDADLPYLKQMHEEKTGALITASVHFGGIIANATQAVNKLLCEFGQSIGLAFQVVDDILDAGEKSTKTTYVSLLGMKKAQAEAERLLTLALDKLALIPNDTTLLAELGKALVHRNI